MGVNERKLAGQDRITFTGISSTSSPLGGTGRRGDQPNLNTGESFLKTAGDTMIGALAFLPNSVTIATGAIDISKDTTDKFTSYVILTGEGAADDTLATITGAFHAGQIIYIQPILTNQITLTETGGNLILPGGSDVVVNAAKDGRQIVKLIFDVTVNANKWTLVSNSAGGAGGEVPVWTQTHDSDGFNLIIDQDADSALIMDRDALIADDELGIALAGLASLDYKFGVTNFTLSDLHVIAFLDSSGSTANILKNTNGTFNFSAVEGFEFSFNNQVIPTLIFDSDNAVDNLLATFLSFNAESDVGSTQREYANIKIRIVDSANTAEQSSMRFALIEAGTEDAGYMSLDSTSLSIQMFRPLDMTNDEIINIEFLERSGTAATAGAIRLVNADDISWDNIGAGVSSLSVSAADDFIFDINAVIKMSITSDSVLAGAGVDFQVVTGRRFQLDGTLSQTFLTEDADDNMEFHVDTVDNFEWFAGEGDANPINRLLSDGTFTWVPDGHEIAPQGTTLDFGVGQTNDAFLFLVDIAATPEETLRIEDDLMRFQGAAFQNFEMFNTANASNGSSIAAIEFTMNNTGGTKRSYASISGVVHDASATLADTEGALHFLVTRGSGNSIIYVIEGGESNTTSKIGWYDKTTAPAVQQTLAASPTAAQISAVLLAYGLIKN